MQSTATSAPLGNELEIPAKEELEVEAARGRVEIGDLGEIEAQHHELSQGDPPAEPIAAQPFEQIVS